MRSSLSLAMAIGLYLLSAVGVTAQEVPVTLKSLDLFAYESAPSWQERGMRPAGAVETVKKKGHFLLDVRAVYDVAWSDSLAKINAKSKEVQLVLEDGTKREVEAYYRYFGQLQLGPRSVNMNRPRKYPDEDQDLYFQAVFLVPDGTTKATLQIGGTVGASTPIEIPAVSQPPRAADFAQISITASRRFRTANTEDKPVTMVLTPPPGHVFLEAQVTVAAKASNEFDDDPRFYWHTSDFRLVDANHRTLGLIGERWFDRIIDDFFNGIDPGKSKAVTMIWTVPESLDKATLLLGEVPVGEIALGDLEILDQDRSYKNP